MKQILIVDNDVDGLHTLQSLLSTYDYHVTVAKNGAQALAITGNHQPDLVIASIRTPAMSGFELCREWKRTQQLKHIPVILYAATTVSREDEQFAHRLGADRVIVKPIDIDRLLKILQGIMEDHCKGQRTGIDPQMENDVVYLKEYNKALVRALEALEQENNALKMEHLERDIKENELGDQLARLQFALELSGQIVWERNLQTGTIIFDQTWSRGSGFQLDELGLDTHTWARLVHPADLPKTEATIKAYLQANTSFYTVDYRVRAGAGKWRWIREQGLVTERDHDGAPLWVFGTCHDITQHKHAETELSEQTELLQTIVDHIPVMLALIGKAGQTQWINREWEHVLGWTLEEIQNGNVLAEMYPDPVQRQEVLDFAINPIPDQWADFRTRIKDGRIIDTSWTNVLLADGRSIGIGQDVSERRRAEEALERSEKRFRALVEHSSEAILLVHADGTPVYASPALPRILGYTLDDLCDDCELNTLIISIISRRNLIHTPGKLITTRAHAQHKDGTWRWLEITAQNLLHDNHVEAVVIDIRDVTARTHAEKALRESEQRYRVLTENSPLGIWQLDVDGHTLYANPAMCLMLGVTSPEDLNGITYHEFFTPKSLKILEGEQSRGWEGFLSTHEVQLVSKNGQCFDVMITGGPLYLSDKDSYSLIAIFTDITRRKQNEKALRQYAERLKILREIDTGIITARSLKAIAESALDHLAHIIDYQWASVVLLDNDSLDFETIQAVRVAVRGHHDMGSGIGVRFPIHEGWNLVEVLQEGKVILAENIAAVPEPSHTQKALLEKGFHSYIAMPLLAHNGFIGALNLFAEKPETFGPEHAEIVSEVAHPLAIAMQQARLFEAERRERLTAQKLREAGEALAGSALRLEETLAIILDQLSQMVAYDWAEVMLVEQKQLSVAAEHNVSHQNDHSKDRFAYQDYSLFDEIIATKQTVLVPQTRQHAGWAQLAPDLPPTATWMGIPLIASGLVIGLISCGNSQPGAFDAQSVKTATLLAQQAALAVANARMFADLESNLTELRHAQEQLRRTERLSAAGELAAGVAHQINNPVGAIIAQSHLLLKRLPPDTPNHQSAEVIQKAAHRAGDIVQRLLDFARTRAYVMEPIDLNSSVLNAVSLLRAQTEPGTIKFVVDLAPDLPPIEGSKEHLEDAWINLLLNAKQALSQQESGVIRVSSAIASSGDHVVVTIQDNGPGIAPGEMAHVFELFYTTKGHGTGIGLALCQEIIEQHNGAIQVESSKRDGTMFSVIFPAKTHDIM